MSVQNDLPDPHHVLPPLTFVDHSKHKQSRGSYRDDLSGNVDNNFSRNRES